MCHSVLLVHCAVYPCGLASFDCRGIVDATYSALFSKADSSLWCEYDPARTFPTLAGGSSSPWRELVGGGSKLPPWRLAQVAAASPNLPGTHERATIPLPATFSTDSHCSACSWKPEIRREAPSEIGKPFQPELDVALFQSLGLLPAWSQCLPRKRRKLTFLRLQIFSTEFTLASTPTTGSLWVFQSNGLRWLGRRREPIPPIVRSQCWTPLLSLQSRWRGRW